MQFPLVADNYLLQQIQTNRNMRDDLDIFPSLTTRETKRKELRKMEIFPFEMAMKLARQQRHRFDAGALKFTKLLEPVHPAESQPANGVW